MKFCIFALFAAVAAAPVANAGIVSDALRITATTPGYGSATWALPVDAGTWSVDHSSWLWTAPADWSHDFVSGGTTLATLSSQGGFSVRFDADPVVSINFTALAGPTTTLFTIASGLLTYDLIDPAQATASAGVTITDRDGDGAQLTGAYDGGFSYLANYNGLVPGGTNFASFNLDATAGTFATKTTFGNTGAFAAISPSSSQSAEFSFRLSANDSVSGTSVFAIIPSPGAIATLGLAGLVAGRRRRA